ncbi:MAG: hypothetical protein ACJ8FY_12215 [Gemmataceae bacterium]
MTTSVRQILDAFDALPDVDKHQAAVEILRRASKGSGDLSEEALAELADELFSALDVAEANHAPS